MNKLRKERLTFMLASLGITIALANGTFNSLVNSLQLWVNALGSIFFSICTLVYAVLGILDR